MSDLIAKLRAATGPDRALDVEIVFALYPDIGAYQPHCAGEEPIFWHDPYRKKRCPHFTASIDAALTLVPAGWSWKAGNRSHRGDNSRDGYANIGLFIDVDAPTPALALCIAALIARGAAHVPA